MNAIIEAASAPTVLLDSPDSFNELLDREFKPKGDEQREAVGAAVRTLAEQALANTVVMSDDAYSSIQAVIAEIDKKLTEQINLILHHEDFQRVEAAWRGLSHLVTHTETDEKLKIRFMDLGKDELRRTMRRYKGVAWDQSPLFKRLYEEEYGQLGGEPYGCLVADYYFDHTPPDVELLGAMARISASAHAPFIAGASPGNLQMETWQELANPRDLAKITSNIEHAAWNSLRATEDARYVGLAMPRFLARLPYGIRTNPVDEFDFEEETEGADHRRYVWANAAYAMAVNINRSFKLYGWCTMIRGVESGGTVEGLPCHTFPTDDGGFDMKCPTEIAVSDRREAELAKAGFIPLVHRKGTDSATFIGAQSLQKPQEYTDPDATANANLSARLPYLFASTRFAHYLKCIVRDKIGAFTFGATAASNFGVRDAGADAPGVADGPSAARPAGDAQTSAGDDGDTVLGELHRRYHATLIDPGAMGSEAPGRHDAAGTDAAVAPGARAFEALVSQSRPDDSLHDLLVAPEAMDTLIARADALGEGDLLRDERVESVLHLFAPTAHRGLAGNDEEFEALMGTASATAPPDSLSSLTRREHHLTGADSALRLGGTSPSMVHANAPSAPEPGEVGHG